MWSFSLPDPYGQFHSPYIAMGNNPVSMIDPDGGYINQSSAGQAARAQFLDQLAYDRSMQRGRYSYEFLYGNYKRDLEALYYQHLDNNEISSEFTGNRFLEALLKLNNEYMGMGLAANYLSSGKDYVSQSSLMSDYGHSLQMDLVKMNGEAEAMQNIILPLPPMGVSNGIMDSEGAFDAWHREYVSEWREAKEAREEQETSFKMEMAEWDSNAGFTRDFTGSSSYSEKGSLTVEQILRYALTLKTGEKLTGTTIGGLNPKFSKAGTAIDYVEKLEGSNLQIFLTFTGSILVKASKDYSAIDEAVFKLSEHTNKAGDKSIHIQSTTAMYGKTLFSLYINDNSSSIGGEFWTPLFKN